MDLTTATLFSLLLLLSVLARPVRMQVFWDAVSVDPIVCTSIGTLSSNSPVCCKLLLKLILHV